MRAAFLKLHFAELSFPLFEPYRKKEETEMSGCGEKYRERERRRVVVWTRAARLRHFLAIGLNGTHISQVPRHHNEGGGMDIYTVLL
ncbi:uncharacterized [Tachysurus ichikawai]